MSKNHAGGDEKPVILETHNLTKHFGSLVAVDGLTFSLHQGEILTLLGPNGAGKTTTVRMLASVLKPTSGWARVAGYDVVKDAQEVRRVIGLLTEFPGLYLRMRAWEYLDFFGELYRIPHRQLQERKEQLLRRFGLWEARNQRLGEYSKGMRQKLALVRAMLHNPLVLYLDEPTSAMDPHSAKIVREAIASLREEKRTAIICTHNLHEAETLSDRIAIINRGRIVAIGTLTELKRRFLGPPVQELRLATPVNGFVEVVSGLARVTAQGDGWIRYQTPKPQKVNPIIVSRIAERGGQVISLTEVPQTLEEVYLKIVGDSGEQA